MIRIVCWSTVMLAVSSAAAAGEPLDFAHEVLPILRDRCARCHAGGAEEGGVTLDSRAALLDSGAVVPGRAAQSRLIERVASEDADFRMPPEGDPLSSQQVAALRRWVDQNLPWPEEVALQQASRATVLELRCPELPPPRAAGGPRQPIDLLVDAYWREHQIEPPPPADDATFIRRLYLDLIGLLPEPERLTAFLADAEPQKRARLIEEVLSQDRRYAEHWLTFWSDLLRNDYAGTGYIDGGRKQITAWLYQSLLSNKPYDQFTRELLHPTAESEGFLLGIQWRGRVNASQVREVQFAQNVGQVFFGINLKCASCHDSFIDQWKLQDAYGLAAIVAEQPLEIHRCDKPTGKMAAARFLFPQLGEIDPSSDRDQRLEQLARLTTCRENGRFARTIVNRLWQRLLGRGLAHPVDVMSNPPWSQEVLDYLAWRLIEDGYDLKKTVQRIVSSETYQSQAVSWPDESPVGDYVFRGPHVKRMQAEQFLDAVWRITRTWPAEPTAQVGPRGDEPVRAALLAADTLMRSLGRPNREQVVTTRPEQLTTLEALDLSNGAVLAELLQRGAARLSGELAGRSTEAIAEWVYLAALARTPTAEELALCRQLAGDPLDQQGFADLLWAVFMLPEFQLIP